MSRVGSDIIGHTISMPNNVFYNILRHNGLKGSCRKYQVECSNCSKDRELYPEIWSRKGDITAGKFSCGCSNRPSYSKHQYEILCKRKATEVGATIDFQKSSFESGKDKIIFIDKHGELQSNMYVAYFLKRYTADVRPSRKNCLVKTDEYYNDIFTKTGYFPKGSVFSRTNNHSIFNVYCPVCAENPLCLNGVREPIFKAHYTNLIKGNRPCFCSPVYRYSVEEYTQRILHEIKEHGEFLYMDGEFKGNRTKFFWKCKCGATKEQVISDFLSGKRCNECASHGFKREVPANFYLYHWSLGENSFLKVGITNNPVRSRITQQKLQTKFIPKEIMIIDFERGHEAVSLENLIKFKFGAGGFIGKNLFADGYTETFNPVLLEEIKRIINDYITQIK